MKDINLFPACILLVLTLVSCQLEHVKKLLRAQLSEKKRSELKEDSWPYSRIIKGWKFLLGVKD